MLPRNIFRIRKLTIDLKSGAARRMFCPACGREIPEGSKFCLKCGRRTGKRGAPWNVVAGFMLVAATVAVIAVNEGKRVARRLEEEGLRIAWC
jgi:hypothetical protein